MGQVVFEELNFVCERVQILVENQQAPLESIQASENNPENLHFSSSVNTIRILGDFKLARDCWVNDPKEQAYGDIQLGLAYLMKVRLCAGFAHSSKQGNIEHCHSHLRTFACFFSQSPSPDLLDPSDQCCISSRAALVLPSMPCLVTLISAATEVTRLVEESITELNDWQRTAPEYPSTPLALVDHWNILKGKTIHKATR
eukprot:3534639-Amphidinium_carterae.1